MTLAKNHHWPVHVEVWIIGGICFQYIPHASHVLIMWCTHDYRYMMSYTINIHPHGTHWAHHKSFLLVSAFCTYLTVHSQNEHHGKPIFFSPHTQPKSWMWFRITNGPVRGGREKGWARGFQSYKRGSSLISTPRSRLKKPPCQKAQRVTGLIKPQIRSGGGRGGVGGVGRASERHRFLTSPPSPAAACSR